MPRMTKDEFSDFKAVGPSPIRVEDMTDRSDRTLMVGYSHKWSGIHFYMKDEVIHCHTWHQGLNPPEDFSYPDGLAPISVSASCAKVYPEQCDREFLALMRDCDPTSFAELRFKDYDSSVPEKQFYAGLSYEHALGLEPESEPSAPSRAFA